jgi:hypothetical protein
MLDMQGQVLLQALLQHLTAAAAAAEHYQQHQSDSSAAVAAEALQLQWQQHAQVASLDCGQGHCAAEGASSTCAGAPGCSSCSSGG